MDVFTVSTIREVGYADSAICHEHFERCLKDWAESGDRKDFNLGDKSKVEIMKICVSGKESACYRVKASCD